MKQQTLFILITLVSSFAQSPFDKYADNGKILASLTEYVHYDYNLKKRSIESLYSTLFNWKFCSMAAFPILRGESCPYFPNSNKYRSIEGKNATAYIADDSHVYVGIKYWFCDLDGIASDTISYSIVSYRSIKSTPPYVWERDREVKTIHTKYGRPFEEE